MSNAVNPSAPVPSDQHQETNVLETVQSLIVAFVLAMTFRGFVTEGFVIPTGSMAPSLLGQHALVHSAQTGIDFPVGMDQSPTMELKSDQIVRLTDPALGPEFRGSVPNNPPIASQRRMGDRILVLKCLYPFAEPSRFDVVVFKNPTDPIGDTSNYIKRLIGLPNEQVWLADGDVFARPLSGNDFHVQRKPEHVQAAVWQMVHESDLVATQIDRLRSRDRYEGPPWTGEHWNTGGRSYTCDTAEPTTLGWDNSRREITDWASYNMLSQPDHGMQPVSDVRVSAAIVAKQPGLKTTFEIEARSHRFQYVIDSTSQTAVLRMRPLNESSDWVERRASLRLPKPGRVFAVEFWHADQSMQMYVDGKAVFTQPLDYDWSPFDRLKFATGAETTDDVDELISVRPRAPRIRWRFEGSPVTLHHVRLDRDLYYRHDMLQARGVPPYITGHAFGTHPTENAANLGPDQFMMCGDNSPMSLDSRLWGRPHPLVADQVDPAPFVVNRRLLLGKAWVVYFPAPFALARNWTPVVPDFGRLRFIR